MYSRFCGLLYIVFCAFKKLTCYKLTHEAFRAKIKSLVVILNTKRVFSC